MILTFLQYTNLAGSGTDSDSDDMPELEEQDPGVASQQAAVAAAAGIQVYRTFSSIVQ